MKNKKQGEQEAAAILRSIGVQLDENYYDDNSEKSMPDFKYLDGRGLEVTHTFHNNAIITKLNNYQKAIRDGKYTLDDLCSMSARCSEAVKRSIKSDYERGTDGKITEEGLKLYKEDCKIMKRHMGYDANQRDIKKRFSEFNCDCPSMKHRTSNILDEITKDKGKKHSSGKTDLFIFATLDEYRNMKKLIPTKEWNGYAQLFLSTILHSPFPTIYVCAWDFDKQEYNTINPEMIKFYKEKEVLNWRWYNYIEENLEYFANIDNG